MDQSIIKFGDVFTYEGKQYVFLAKVSEIIYTGQILNLDKSEQILNARKKKRTSRQKRIRYCM